MRRFSPCRPSVTEAAAKCKVRSGETALTWGALPQNCSYAWAKTSSEACAWASFLAHLVVQPLANASMGFQAQTADYFDALASGCACTRTAGVGDPGTIQFPQTPQAPQDEDRRLSTLIADLPSARCQLKHLPDARSCDRPAGTQRAFSHGR